MGYLLKLSFQFYHLCSTESWDQWRLPIIRVVLIVVCDSTSGAFTNGFLISDFANNVLNDKDTYWFQPFNIIWYLEPFWSLILIVVNNTDRVCMGSAVWGSKVTLYTAYSRALQSRAWLRRAAREVASIGFELKNSAQFPGSIAKPNLALLGSLARRVKCGICCCCLQPFIRHLGLYFTTYMHSCEHVQHSVLEMEDVASSDDYKRTTSSWGSL